MSANSSELLKAARGKVGRLELLQMATIRRTLQPGLVDDVLRLCQRTLGQSWITLATKNLHHCHYLDRLEPLAPSTSFIMVANHRSFFDLYILTAALLRWKMRHRIVFPVRSTFFYDTPQGFLVNGAMSFFAMYPPLFREKKRRTLNLLGIEELAGLLRNGETLVGIHPEGTRNLGDDPYTLLPAHSGVGRLICAANVPVVPVFTNGLRRQGLSKQIRGNFDGTGTRIHSVFGHPIDYSELLSNEPPSPRLYAKLAKDCLEHVRRLGEEERAIRAREESGYSPPYVQEQRPPRKRSLRAAAR